jgi:hypothetical protein
MDGFPTVYSSSLSKGGADVSSSSSLQLHDIDYTTVRAVVDNRMAKAALRTRGELELQCKYDVKVHALHLLPFDVQGFKYQKNSVLEGVAAVASGGTESTGGTENTGGTDSTENTDSIENTEDTESSPSSEELLQLFNYGVASDDTYLQTLTQFLGPSQQPLQHSFTLQRRYPLYQYMPMDLEAFTVSVPRTDYLVAFANVTQRLALSAGAFTVDLADPHGTLLSLDVIAGCRETSGACKVASLTQSVQHQATSGSLFLSMEATSLLPSADSATHTTSKDTTHATSADPADTATGAVGAPGAEDVQPNAVQSIIGDMDGTAVISIAVDNDGSLGSLLASRPGGAGDAVGAVGVRALASVPMTDLDIPAVSECLTLDSNFLGDYSMCLLMTEEGAVYMDLVGDNMGVRRRDMRI